MVSKMEYPKAPMSSNFYFPDHEPGKGRYFKVGGKKYLFHLRKQPKTKMHSQFVDQTTIKYKAHAELIKKNIDKYGLTAKIIKVAKGYRIYWAFVPKKV